MRRGNILAIAAMAVALGATASCRTDRSVPPPTRHDVKGTTAPDTVPDARDSSRASDRSVDSAASPVPIASPARDDAGRINQSGTDSTYATPRSTTNIDDGGNSTAGPNSGGTRDALPATTPAPVDPD